MSKVELRNVTRNQATADYSRANVFIGDNKYVSGVFKNTSGSSFLLENAILAARSLTVTDGFIPVTEDNLADIIGVAYIDGSLTLANNATANINVCTGGKIDGLLLSLPDGVTLDTVVGNKVLKDVLEGIGFRVDTSTVQMTKFDN